MTRILLNTLNINTLNQIEAGKKIIKEKGGENKYDNEIRARFKPKLPDIDYKSHKNITFER